MTNRSADMDVELALLEAENERLREEAAVLLTRQKLLEDLVAQTGAKGKAGK